MARLHIGDLTDRITLDIAQSMLITLAKTRIERNNITPAEGQILGIIVQKNECITTEVAKEIKKSSQYVGKVLNKLFESKLLNVRKYGKSKFYTPSLDAIIAYTENE